ADDADIARGQCCGDVQRWTGHHVVGNADGADAVGTNDAATAGASLLDQLLLTHCSCCAVFGETSRAHGNDFDAGCHAVGHRIRYQVAAHQDDGRVDGLLDFRNTRI